MEALRIFVMLISAKVYFTFTSNNSIGAIDKIHFYSRVMLTASFHI